MSYFKPYTLNIRGTLYRVDSPQVMGILNVTPDSFYNGSRCTDEQTIRKRVRTIVDEGAQMLDIGGYSSRPGADNISADEEYSRLSRGLRIIKEEAPDIIVSVDTFRADVAQRCYDDWGIDIVNDIAAGGLDNRMIETVARIRVPYIMMHMRGNPHTMTSLTDYNDIVGDILQYFGEKISEAAFAGINDIIIDPGFGFSKTLDQNYELLERLDVFKALDMPILVGMSRKSMLYRLLDTTPAESLNSTSSFNVVSLLKGASIIRVHDVRQAVEACRIISKLNP